MIITELNGGLGNQMFQYAVARRLSIKNGTKLKLDITTFDTYKLREYELCHFQIEEDFATLEEVVKLKYANGLKRHILQLKNKIFKNSVQGIREKNFCFDSQILSLSDNIYLQGYWQSAKYFEDIEDIIRKDFSLRETLSEMSEKVAQEIRGGECPVSLHIRRGDYVSNPEVNSVHGTCSLEYYKKCVHKIAEKYKKVTLFIFSDDPEWVKENLYFESPMIFVNHNGASRAYEDMYLMSLCHHHIIANSSFSWWGAWLNPRKSKIVFAPKVWFLDDRLDTKDLLPKGWITI